MAAGDAAAKKTRSPHRAAAIGEAPRPTRQPPLVVAAVSAAAAASRGISSPRQPT
jgi:hypothetical protein